MTSNSPSIYFVRHARAVVDLEMPSSDWPLATDALLAMRPILAKLADGSVKTVWSSPEQRAHSTAQHVADTLGCRLVPVDGLAEHQRDGAYRPRDDAEFRLTLQRFFDHADEPVFGTETADMAFDRFRQAVGFILGQASGDSVIVTHGTVLSLFLGRLKNENEFQIWCELRTPDLVEVPRSDAERMCAQL